MRFSADPKELIRILGALYDPDEEDGDDTILAARDLRFVATNRSGPTKETGTGAMVFEPGECVISRNQLRHILLTLKLQCGKEKHPQHILVEIKEDRLNIGSVAWKVGQKQAVILEENVDGTYELDPSQKPNKWLGTRWWEEPGSGHLARAAGLKDCNQQPDRRNETWFKKLLRKLFAFLR